MAYEILHDLGWFNPLASSSTTRQCVIYDRYALNSMTFFPFFFEIALASKLLNLIFPPPGRVFPQSIAWLLPSHQSAHLTHVTGEAFS